MKTGFSKDFFELLRDIRLNNNRDWYLLNKQRVNEARKEMEDFANLLIPQVRKFDKNIEIIDAKDTMYRQNRDIRFSQDKSPYKSYISSVLFYGNKRLGGNIPCYYLHLEDGSGMIAGGIHAPETTTLKKIREEIFYNVDEFKSIINNKEFLKYFPSINSEERLKTAPKGFPKDWKDIDLLRNKEYCPAFFFSVEKAMEEGFLDFVLDAYKSMKSFNEFLFRALA